MTRPLCNDMYDFQAFHRTTKSVILSESEESLRLWRNMRPLAARSFDSLRSLRMTDQAVQSIFLTKG